jgi:hypothetical protein
LYIAWRKVYSGDVRDVVVARSTDGGVTFEAPVRVHRDNWVYPGCPHAGPSLAVDSAGTLHVVWYTGAEGHTGLYLATSRDGARTFGEPVALRRGRGFVSVSNARLAATGSSVWVAWEDRAASGGRVQLGHCGPDGVLRPQGSFNRPGHSPAIVAGPAGVAVAWLAGDSILVAAARPDVAPPPHAGGTRASLTGRPSSLLAFCQSESNTYGPRNGTAARSRRPPS